MENPPANAMKKQPGLRQYILIGVLIVLLVILGVVYLNLGASPATTVKKVKNSASAITVPTVPPVGRPILSQTTITTIPLDLKNVKIRIMQSVQANEKAANLKNELIKIGLADIVSEVSENSTAEKSSVIFSQSIPSDLRNSIITEVKKILTDVSILENQDIDLIITIILGKS